MAGADGGVGKAGGDEVAGNDGIRAAADPRAFHVVACHARVSGPLQPDLRIDDTSGQARDEGGWGRAHLAGVGAFTCNIQGRHHEVIRRAIREAGDDEVGRGHVRHDRILRAADC